MSEETLQASLKKANDTIAKLSAAADATHKTLDWQNKELSRLHGEVASKDKAIKDLQAALDEAKRKLAAEQVRFQQELLAANLHPSAPAAEVGDIGPQHSSVLFNHEDRIAALEARVSKLGTKV